jgi:hypothetical protein
MKAAISAGDFDATSAVAAAAFAAWPSAISS